MKPTSALVVLLASCVTGSAWAQQTGNPAAMSPDTPKAETAQPPPDHPNTVDQLFVRQAAIGGMAEVELGKLAAQRAQSDAVKEFARQMTKDHGDANERLMKLARSHEVPLPKEPDADQKAVRAQLERLNGAAFDVAYMSAQVGDHQKTAHLLEHEIGSGQDVRTKDYAKETLPTVLKHLRMAKEIQATLTGAPTRTAEADTPDR
jgi:putative membrane protein